MSDDTIEASENEAPPAVGQILRVEKEEILYKKYLTPKALACMDGKQAKTLVAVEEDGKCYRAIFFSVLIRKGNTEKGVKVIAKIINELAEEGLIHSILSPISSLTLAKQLMVFDQAAVFCFPLVPADKHDEITKRYNKIAVPEGGIGESVDDFRLPLEDGEFVTALYVMPDLNAACTREEMDLLVQKEIDSYLSVLPKGTVVRDIVPCAIASLALPYEVHFYNPLMKKVKSVSLDYVRCIERVEGKLEEFNLLTGIKYFDIDKKELFK